MPPITVPLADPHGDRRQLGRMLDEAVKRVLDSGWYILGSETEVFEKEFNCWLGHDGHCVGSASGTDAIEVAMRVLGVRPGDAVITVSHTAVATVAAIERLGAIPVLTDVRDDTYCMDALCLTGAIQWCRKNGFTPRAVVPVHLYGHPADIVAIEDIALQEGLYVIEDCAQATGAMLDGRKVGTFGQASCFSFYPTKNLGAAGDGGMVRFRNAVDAARARKMRQYGWGEDRSESEFSGINSRLDELQAAILRAKLPYLDGWLERRRQIASLYSEELADTGVILPECKPGIRHAYHLFVMRTPNRDGLRQYLWERGIGTGIHYPMPVHLMPAYKNRLPVPGPMRVTEAIVKEIISIPLHPHLNGDQVQAVIGSIRNWRDAWATR